MGTRGRAEIGGDMVLTQQTPAGKVHLSISTLACMLHRWHKRKPHCQDGSLSNE
jgi:hypothetical protein